MTNIKRDYNCNRCKDTYWVGKITNGKSYSIRCDCFTDVLIRGYIPAVYRKKFQETGYKQPYFQITTQGFLINSEKRMLVLWGQTGVGKTFLAWKLFEAYGTPRGFRYMSQINIRDLAKILKLRVIGFSELEEVNEAKHQKLIDSNFIFIDEFWIDESVRTADFCSWFSQFLDCITGDKKIVITTNYNPLAVKQVDEALYCRLTEVGKSMIVKMEGKNWRSQ